MDLDEAIPNADDIYYHPPDSMIARAAASKRKERVEENSGGGGKEEGGKGKKQNKKAKVREESRRMNMVGDDELAHGGKFRKNYNFAQFHGFGTIVRMEHLGNGEVVVVEGVKKEIGGSGKGYGMG